MYISINLNAGRSKFVVTPFQVGLLQNMYMPISISLQTIISYHFKCCFWVYSGFCELDNLEKFLVLISMSSSLSLKAYTVRLCSLLFSLILSLFKIIRNLQSKIYSKSAHKWALNQ